MNVTTKNFMSLNLTASFVIELEPDEIQWLSLLKEVDKFLEQLSIVVALLMYHPNF